VTTLSAGHGVRRSAAEAECTALGATAPDEASMCAEEASSLPRRTSGLLLTGETSRERRPSMFAAVVSPLAPWAGWRTSGLATGRGRV
jgi:hypothetical protein